MIEEFKEYLEVSVDEYRSFTKELKPEFFHKEEETFDGGKAYYIVSNNSDKLICGNTYDQNTETVHYYIVNMPEDNERSAPQKIRKIVLESEEEVKAFFDIINKATKKEGK